jgi:uncharacterized protein (TIGR02611 family)
MKVRLGAVRKIFRTALGFLVLFAGLIMAIPGVPGPGFAFVLLGLVILSAHYHWARRLLAWAKRKAEAVRDSLKRGRQPGPEA